jgi:hypothetical protein
MDTLFPGTFKKRWLRPMKQWVCRFLEVKSGIFLSQSVVDVSDSERTNDNAPPRVTEATRAEPGLLVSGEEFQRRTRQGNRLYQMHLDNQLVSWGWVAGPGTRIGVLHDLYLTVPEGALYIWDCVTIPEYRGRGCFPGLLEGILCAHRPTSTLALVAVDVRNGASRRALAKAGFRPGFTYISVRTLGLGLLSIAFKGGKIGRAQPWFDAIGQ